MRSRFFDNYGERELWRLLGINPNSVRNHSGHTSSGDWRGDKDQGGSSPDSYFWGLTSFREKFWFTSGILKEFEEQKDQLIPVLNLDDAYLAMECYEEAIKTVKPAEGLEKLVGTIKELYRERTEKW